MDNNIDWTKVRYFKPSEFEHPEWMNPALLEKLERLRARFGRPLVITSSYRTTIPKPSAHHLNAFVQWDAVDVRVATSRERFELLSIALDLGFRRIGVYDKHIHLDVATGAFPQDVLWIGEST